VGYNDDEYASGYNDDEYASIEARALDGVWGSWWSARGERAGNGFIFLGALVALIMPLVVGIPLVVLALWRVARHRYHAWFGVVIALASVGLGLLFIAGTDIPLL
jgi:hypothetical protein